MKAARRMFLFVGRKIEGRISFFLLLLSPSGGLAENHSELSTSHRHSLLRWQAEAVRFVSSLSTLVARDLSAENQNGHRSLLHRQRPTDDGGARLVHPEHESPH